MKSCAERLFRGVRLPLVEGGQRETGKGGRSNLKGRRESQRGVLAGMKGNAKEDVFSNGTTLRSAPASISQELEGEKDPSGRRQKNESRAIQKSMGQRGQRK